MGFAESLLMTLIEYFTVKATEQIELFDKFVAVK